MCLAPWLLVLVVHLFVLSRSLFSMTILLLFHSFFLDFLFSVSSKTLFQNLFCHRLTFILFINSCHLRLLYSDMSVSISIRFLLRRYCFVWRFYSYKLTISLGITKWCKEKTYFKQYIKTVKVSDFFNRFLLTAFIINV